MRECGEPICLLFLLLHLEGGAGWGWCFLLSFSANISLLILPLFLFRRVSWGSRRCWLSWWRCHQSQMGGWDLGKGQSKCQGSEREGPWAGQGGNWEAPHVLFLLLMMLLLSPSASSAKAVVSHPGGVLVWEPAPPYQEGWPEGESNRRTLSLDPVADNNNAVVAIQYGGPGEPCMYSSYYWKYNLIKILFELYLLLHFLIPA